MTARERILTIRLLDKAVRHPQFARSLGIEGTASKMRAKSAGSRRKG